MAMALKRTRSTCRNINDSLINGLKNIFPTNSIFRSTQYSDQLNIPTSAGTLFNFNQKASNLIEQIGAADQIKAAL
jgi:hypothetical protein